MKIALKRFESIRRGRTLVELLVATAVFTILLSFLTIGAQRMRVFSVRSACAQNFLKIGGAFLTHQDVHGLFPDAGDSWTDGRSMRSAGAPAVTPNQDWGCWYQILPHLGYENAWSSPDDRVPAGTIVPTYFCPARRTPVAYPGIQTANLPAGGDFKRGALDYAGSGGYVNPPFSNNAQRMNGAIVPRFNTDHVSAFNIIDGASNTMLASERNFNRKRAGDWNQYDENNGYFNGWDWDTIRWAYDAPAPDRYDDSNADYRFGSSHPDGMNVLLADGSVRFVQFSVDLTTFQLLCGRADGEPMGDIWR